MTAVGAIWVIGELGQIGSALVSRLGDRAVAPSIAELDLAFPDRIRVYFDSLQAARGTPAAVINAAAYTLVDQAEREPSLARAINAEAPAQMARWCAQQGVPFVHYSTDYVYPGTGSTPWREDDAATPLNAYGRTKLEGDELIQASSARFLILRTSWVYDSRGRNFFTTIMNLSRQRETLRIVADQVGAPSYAPHLAALTLELLERTESMQPFPTGTYHFCHGGEVSWHGFAQAICAIARANSVALVTNDVVPIATGEYPTLAMRPLNSRLDNSKLRTVFHDALPPWEDGLRACLDEWLERNG